MPHKAVRFKSGGKYLKNTLFSTSNSDYVGAWHGVPTDAIFDAELAAEEEAMSIASWTADFAIAFGIPAEEIECEVIAWDGNPDSLPKEDEPNARERLPVKADPTPVPVKPTLTDAEILKLKAIAAAKV